jgi:glycosyltransferase involved in cell wall biosynthesis
MDVAIAPLEMNTFNDSKSDIKVAEAGRYKVPLIASNVGCYNETIKNGETGYLIDPDAPKTEWVRILSKVCKDKNHRKQMGESLHKITEDLFSARKVAKQRYDLYLRAMQDVGYKLQ